MIRQGASVLALLAAMAVAGCEDQGPVERAGEEIDEAVEDVRAGGETMGNKVDDAVDEAREGVEDAAEEVTE